MLDLIRRKKAEQVDADPERTRYLAAVEALRSPSFADLAEEATRTERPKVAGRNPRVAAIVAVISMLGPIIVGLVELLERLGAVLK